MRRREFFRFLGGGAATALPLPARAQRDQHLKLVVALSGTATAADQQARMAVFRQAMLQLGWSEGRNVRFDIRWGGGNTDTTHKQAEELVALAPDIILASGSTALAAF